MSDLLNGIRARVACATAFVGFGLLLAAGPAAAQGIGYHFTKIADAAQVPNIASATCVAVNSPGSVIFTTSDGVVWKGNGATLTRVAEPGASGQPLVIACPGLDDANRVVYAFAFSSGYTALIQKDGAVTTELARSDAVPYLDETGDTAVHSLTSTGSTIAKGLDGRFYIVPSGTAAYTLGPSDPPLFSVASGSMNENGVLAFLASRLIAGVPKTGIYRGSGLPLVEDGHAVVALVKPVRPVINAAGVVAFLGQFADGSVHVLSTGDGTTINDHSGSIGSDASQYFSINDGGTVAYLAELSGSATGIFTGPDVALDRVIAPGDALDGSSVVTAKLSYESINATGQISFWAELADGRSGVYRAEPVFPPIANDGALALFMNTTAVGTLVASDPAGLPLEFSIVSNGTKGTAYITDPWTGEYSYTAAPNAIGTDTFSFVANNGVLGSNVATVTVTITPSGVGGNSAPIAQSEGAGPASSVRFDDVGDELFRTTDLPPVSQFTMMGWFRALGGTSPNGVLLRYGDATNSNGYNIYRGGGGATIPSSYWLTLWNGTGLRQVGPITPNTWYHVAVTVEGTGPGQLKLYLNGVLTYTWDGNPNVTPEKFSIGNDTHDEWLDGNAAAVKVYDAALSQSEIATEMLNFDPVRTADLDSWYPLQTSATATTDYSGNGRTLTATGVIDTAVDGPPLLAGTAFVTTANTPLHGSLHATDPEGNPLTYAIVSNGTKGTVVITDPATGAYTYTPNPNVTGTDTFTFVANDGLLDSNVATVTIMVTAATVPVTVTTAGDGSGNIVSSPIGISCPGVCSSLFEIGQIVTLSATASAGSVFVGWSGACTGTGPCTLTVDAAMDATATFALSTRDLVVSGTSVPPAQAAPGTAFSFIVTTSNTGTDVAAKSTTRFYLSQDAAKSPDDILFGASAAVPALNGGESVTLSPNLTVPTGTPDGLYELLVCADDTDAVAESSEANNCIDAGPIQIQRPDLVEVSIADPPANMEPGKYFKAPDTAQNIGPIEAAASSTRFYLSLDDAYSADDVVIPALRSIGVLPAGATSSGAPWLQVPAATPLGTYYLLACADALSKVLESDESNNCIASSSTLVVGHPDLIESGLTVPAGAAPGSTFSVTDTVENIGTASAGPSTTRYYLSPDGQLSTGVLFAATRAVGTVVASGTSSGSKSLTLPTTTSPGSYYVVACADDLTVVNELDDSNNCLVSSTALLVSWSDLLTTSVSAPPTETAPGQTFPLSSSVLNQGSLTTAASTSRAYLSFDTVKDGGDILLTGAIGVPSLTGGAGWSGTRNVTVPKTTPGGTYFVLDCADDLDKVMEANESNNCLVAPTQVAVRLADLVQSAVSNPPATTTPGGTFSTTGTVSNLGDISSGGWSITRYYLSPDSTVANGVQLTAKVWIKSLAAGQSINVSQTLTVPTSLPLGNYFVVACADDGNLVIESNETNNCKASSTSVSIIVATMDLVETSLTLPPGASPGGTFSVTDVVQNLGTAQAGPSTTRFYLSPNGQLATSVLLPETRSVGTVAVAGTSSGSTVLTLPASVAAGSSYYVIACADDLGAVSETDESNNCRVSSSTLLVSWADLVTTGVNTSAATVAPGAAFSITSTVLNQGPLATVATASRVYLSLDATKDAGDILLTGNLSVPGLAGNTSWSGSRSVTVPKTTPLGTYFVVACADDLGQMFEADESNNCIAAATTVDVRMSDLVEIAVSNPPASSTIGGTFLITDTSMNQGNAPTGTSTMTRYYLSPDGTRTNGVLTTAKRWLNSMAVGQKSTDSRTITVPTGLASGSYFVVVCADDIDLAVESDETNNCTASSTPTTIP